MLKLFDIFICLVQFMVTRVKNAFIVQNTMPHSGRVMDVNNTVQTSVFFLQFLVKRVIA